MPDIRISGCFRAFPAALSGPKQPVRACFFPLPTYRTRRPESEPQKMALQSLNEKPIKKTFNKSLQLTK